MSDCIMILDTETTDLMKCFCYDVGYQIIRKDGSILESKHFVIEQVWHNLPLFESAYYKEKRPLYVQLMRKHRAILQKWGYVMQEMKRDIKNHNVTDAYAYNSEFDDKVFSYNCDWFKCMNPLDNVAIHDIWGYASQFITGNKDYREFCEANSFFTDTGNYKGSAEVVFRFLLGDTDFEEAHMGLHDVEIETEILKECINRGAEWDTDYKVEKILKREQKKPFTIKINGKPIYTGKYTKKYTRNDVYNFTVSEG